MTTIRDPIPGQLPLPLGVEPEHRPGVAERFIEFHAEHPEVFEALLAAARSWRSRGATRLGVPALVEEVRWWTPGIGPIDNTLRPFYARLLAAEPDLAGMIELRRSVADDWITARDAA